MSATLAYEDEVIEKEFRHHLFLTQRAFCRDYHCISAAMPTVALACLIYQWSAGPILTKLMIQAGIVLLSSTALHLISNQPALFSRICQPWHVFQRVFACLRCCDIRSILFMVPDQIKLLQRPFNMQFFIGSLLGPCFLHCFGLPLPLGLDALTAGVMLITLWMSNATFCSTVGDQDDGSISGGVKFIERWMFSLWNLEGQDVFPMDRQ
jgi:hypothetical protein